MLGMARQGIVRRENANVLLRGQACGGEKAQRDEELQDEARNEEARQGIMRRYEMSRYYYLSYKLCLKVYCNMG